MAECSRYSPVITDEESNSDEDKIDDQEDEGYGPRWRRMFTSVTSDHTGYCTELKDAIELVREFLKPYLNRIRFYHLKTHHKNFGSTDIPKNVVLEWEDKKPHMLPYDGQPFIYLNQKVWACQGQYSKFDQSADEYYTSYCPARIYIKEVIKFPQYEISNGTARLRQMAENMLKRDINRRITSGERRFYIRLPVSEEHSNHQEDGGGVGAYYDTLDDKLVSQIEEYLAQGVNDPEDMRDRLRETIRAQLPADVADTWEESRFVPSVERVWREMTVVARQMDIELPDGYDDDPDAPRSPTGRKRKYSEGEPKKKGARGRPKKTSVPGGAGWDAVDIDNPRTKVYSGEKGRGREFGGMKRIKMDDEPAYYDQNEYMASVKQPIAVPGMRELGRAAAEAKLASAANRKTPEKPKSKNKSKDPSDQPCTSSSLAGGPDEGNGDEDNPDDTLEDISKPDDIARPTVWEFVSRDPKERAVYDARASCRELIMKLLTLITRITDEDTLLLLRNILSNTITQVGDMGFESMVGRHLGSVQFAPMGRPEDLRRHPSVDVINKLITQIKTDIATKLPNPGSLPLHSTDGGPDLTSVVDKIRKNLSSSLWDPSVARNIDSAASSHAHHNILRPAKEINLPPRSKFKDKPIKRSGRPVGRPPRSSTNPPAGSGLKLVPINLGDIPADEIPLRLNSGSPSTPAAKTDAIQSNPKASPVVTEHSSDTINKLISEIKEGMATHSYAATTAPSESIPQPTVNTTTVVSSASTGKIVVKPAGSGTTGGQIVIKSSTGSAIKSSLPGQIVFKPSSGAIVSSGQIIIQQSSSSIKAGSQSTPKQLVVRSRIVATPSTTAATDGRVVVNVQETLPKKEVIARVHESGKSTDTN